MNEESQTATQTLDETLNKTDLGTIINENKKPILIAAAIVVALVIIVSLFMHQSEKGNKESLNKVFEVKNTLFKPFVEDKKMKADDFLAKLKLVSSEVKASPSLFPSFMASVDKLVEDKKLKEAISIMESWEENLSGDSYQKFFYNQKLASLYLDNNENKKAAKSLTSLKESKVNVLKSYTLYQLASVQMKLNNKEEARKNLDLIVKDYKDSDEAKLSKYLLAKEFK